MDWKKYYFVENEKPLDRFVEGYSFTSVFRTVAFVGDSLSSGEFEVRDENNERHYHDLYEHSWGQYMARRNGFAAYNFSKGGMTAKKYIESFAEERGFWDKRKAAQAYVIALGVNDLNHSDMELGSVADVDINDCRNNKETITGYYAMIVARYKEISPDAKFFFVTMPKGRGSKREERAGEFREVLYGLSKLFDNSYVIDLYQYAPVYDDDFKEKFYLHGHMNPAGYIFTAHMIDSYIDYIIRHNAPDFKRVGLIGTGIEDKHD